MNKILFALISLVLTFFYLLSIILYQPNLWGVGSLIYFIVSFLILYGTAKD